MLSRDPRLCFLSQLPKFTNQKRSDGVSLERFQLFIPCDISSSLLACCPFSGNLKNAVYTKWIIVGWRDLGLNFELFSFTLFLMEVFCVVVFVM